MFNWVQKDPNYLNIVGENAVQTNEWPSET